MLESSIFNHVYSFLNKMSINFLFFIIILCYLQVWTFYLDFWPIFILFKKNYKKFTYFAFQDIVCSVKIGKFSAKKMLHDFLILFSLPLTFQAWRNSSFLKKIHAVYKKFKNLKLKRITVRKKISFFNWIFKKHKPK